MRKITKTCILVPLFVFMLLNVNIIGSGHEVERLDYKRSYMYSHQDKNTIN